LSGPPLGQARIVTATSDGSAAPFLARQNARELTFRLFVGLSFARMQHDPVRGGVLHTSIRWRESKCSTAAQKACGQQRKRLAMDTGTVSKGNGPTRKG